MSLDGRVERPVEVLEGFVIAEASGLGPFVDHALLPDVEFVLKDQFQELLVRELMSASLFQA